MKTQNSFNFYPIIVFAIFLSFLSVSILAYHSISAQSVDYVHIAPSNNTDQKKPLSIGLTATEITQEISNIYDYTAKDGGLLVTKVSPNGPAYQAGIRGGNQTILINGLPVKIGGDIILTADNKSFFNAKDFQQYYKHKSIGENMTLKILRNGISKLVNVILGQNPSQIYENVSKFRNPNYLQLSTYYNFNLPIKIGYPSSWNVSKNLHGDPEFVSNYANPDDKVLEYITIYTVPDASNLSKLVAYQGDNGTTYSSPNSTHLGPYRALGAVYKLDTKVGEIRLFKVATTVDGNGYVLSYYADPSNFGDYLPTVKRIISSFKVLNLITNENFDDGLRIKYPSNWIINRSSVYDWKSLTFIHDKNKTGLNLKISPIYDSPDEAKKAFNQTIESILSSLSVLPNFKVHSEIHNDGKTHSSYFANISYGDPNMGKIISLQNISMNNNRLYWSSYTTIKNDYLKNFPLVKSVLSSLRTFEKLRYENNSLGIISYYPSDWNSSSDHSFFSPSKFGEIIFSPNASAIVFSYDNNCTDLASTAKTSKSHRFSLNTTIGTKIGAKIIYQNITNLQDIGDRNISILTHGMRIFVDNKPLVIDYCETLYPGETSFMSTVDHIINSLRIADSFPIHKELFHYKKKPDFVVSYPQNWTVSDSRYAVNFNQSDMNVVIGPAFRNYTKIEQIASQDIQNLVKTPSEYKFINSTIIKSNNTTKYEIEFQVKDRKYLDTYFSSNNNTYPIYYSASADNYSNYLPHVKYVINSFEPIKNSIFKPTGYHVGGLLSGIGFNPITNILYVADTQFNVVHVLDTINNKKIADIPVGKSPQGIAVDAGLNTIYVANSDSNSVSVIEGSKNAIVSTIQVGEEPLIITVNPITHMAYVGDANTHVLYRIDGVTHIVNQTSTGGTNETTGIGVAVNDRMDRVYVANPDTHNVTVIDGKTLKIISNISIFGESPIDIAVNALSNMGYVLTNEYAGVRSIDLSDYDVRSVPIKEAIAPYSLAVNPLLNIVYISDFSSNSKIHAIHVLNKNNLSSITVDPYPTFLAVDSATGTTYVSSLYGTVSILDDDADLIRYGIRYHINSNTSGLVFCNGKKISDNYYATYLSNQLITCKVNSTNFLSPILFTSWKQNYDPTKKTMEPVQAGNFDITGHGDISINVEDLSSLIQRWSKIMSFVTVSLVIVIASVPSTIFKGKGNGKSKQKYVLEKSEIFGINGSVIVGVLVFLSLEGFNESQQSEITFVTASIIFPFILSFIVTVLGKTNYATRLIIAGFINLMISIILIVTLRYRT